MSQKKYVNSAERQRAHRQRIKERLAGLGPVPASGQLQRRETRPRRLARVADELRALSDEYQAWLDAIPRNLSGAEVVERLQETIGYLHAALDEVEQILPPKGFGR